MRQTLNLQQIRSILGDSLSIAGATDPSPWSRLITDSRTPVADETVVFAALRTTVNDGHKYIPALYSHGVRTFLVDTLPTSLDTYPLATFLLVPHVLSAIGKIAAALNSNNAEQIVITGSTHKTEVKETLYRGLRSDGLSVFRSPRSFNSYLGVCLSIFENYFNGGSDIQIFEVGIDGYNQAASLSEILHSTVGIITDITTEHDENFASHADKIREKLTLFGQAHRIIYNDNDPELAQIVSELYCDKAELTAVSSSSSADIAAAAYPSHHFTDIAPESMHTAIMAGVRGNTLMIDAFTPDRSSIRQALEHLVRHSSPGRALVAAFGTVDDGVDIEEINVYGLSRVYYFSDDDAITVGEEASKDLHDSDILVFGKHNASLEAFVNALERADHDTTLTVDIDAILHNYNAYRHMVLPGTGIVAMVKASAYGLGSIEVAKALQSAGAAALAVAVVDEGVEMRSAGITMPIMVMNPMTRHYDALFSNKLEPAIFSIEELQRLIKEASRLGIKRYPTHIKFDTGMHRVGIVPKQLPLLADLLKAQTEVRVDSVFSHLATADCLDKDAYTLSQLNVFRDMASDLASRLGHKVKRHILNTAGMMRFAKQCDYEMARLGIGLYGVSPLPTPDSRLQIVASLSTVVISIKRWPAGTPIGYANRGMTPRESVIATIPIGYADGIDRRLGNGAASFMVNGTACPTIGNICMDMCMIDVTDAPNVELGTPVEIFGHNRHVETLADTLGTIPYEIFTSVSPRVQRCYISK